MREIFFINNAMVGYGVEIAPSILILPGVSSVERLKKLTLKLVENQSTSSKTSFHVRMGSSF
eukprot:scaffold1506_cov74-Cylindrotheca_fusiformis.AAC.4